MEEFEESIRSLRKSLDLQPMQSKPKFRLVIAIVFQYRKANQLQIQKEKEEREIKLKKLMCKVCYFRLKLAASKMEIDFVLPEKTFESEEESSADEVIDDK